jgi:hypothetical protein
MILPDDVLCIIREYSKPRMRFYKEYKDAMKDIGLIDWPEVREKLCSSRADRVIRGLLNYTYAFVETEEVKSMYSLAVHPFHQRFYSIELSRHALNRDYLQDKLKRLLE